MIRTDDETSDAAPGWWEYDPASGGLHLDQRARELHGLETGDAGAPGTGTPEAPETPETSGAPELTPHTLWSTVTTSDGARWERTWNEVLGPEGPDSFEAVVRPASDGARPLRVIGRLQRDEGAAPVRWVGFVEPARPVARATRHAEDALDRQQELLDRLVEASPVMITVYDPNVERIRLNPHFSRVLGWTNDDIRDGAELLELCYPDPEYRAEVLDFMASPGEGWQEIDVVAKDGSVVPTTWANIRLSDDRQVGIGMDVRDRKRTEEALRERVRVAEVERAALERVAERSPAVIAIYSGPEHVITMFNPTWEKVVRRPEALGKPVREAFPELESTDLLEALDRVYRTGEAHVAHERPVPLRREGRTEISYWNFLWEPLRDERGEVTDIFVHAVEVTEHVESRREVEELRAEVERDLAQLEAVVDRIDEGLIVADMQGQLTRWNPRALEIHGFSDAVEGRRKLEAFDELFEIREPDGTPLPVDRWPIARALEGDTFSGVDLAVTSLTDGWTRTFRYGGGPVHGSDGEQILALITVRDVTQQVEQQRQLAQAKQVAEMANRAKSEFLASMSHELRTPLNAIGGYTDLLDAEVHGPITPEQRQALDRVMVSQRVLLQLINDVLNFAKIESGQIQIRPRPFAIREIVRDLEAVVRGLADRKGLETRFPTCDDDLHVVADPDRTRQILLNLLGNAVKYTPAGGRVELACDVQPEALELHVVDTGPGISAADHERIFDPFVQLSDTSDDPSTGVGLGLAISRDLARSMDGDILVDSEKGRGSRFTLRLPRVP